MPIATVTSEVPVEKPPVVEIATPEYKGVTVDTRYVPTNSLMTHVIGMPWSVEYYSQVLGADSAVQGQSLTLDATQQQYRRIRDFEMKVSNPLTLSQDTESNAMIQTGSANVYPFLIPNDGDMFLADIGDGREGVFQVTNVERKMLGRDTTHLIEYQLISYSSDERVGDLHSKTIQTLQFVKGLLVFGQNPLLKEEEYANLKELSRLFRTIAKRYFAGFTSNEFKTLLVPSQSYTYYDHFLVSACMAFFSTDDSNDLLYVRKLNVDGDYSMKATSIWDALIKRDPDLVRHAFRTVGSVSALTFSKDPMLEGIAYIGINNVVYPKDAELSVDYTLVDHTKLTELFVLQDKPSRFATELPDLTGLDITIPLIHPVNLDESYVFSSAFYDTFYQSSQAGVSLLEVLVKNHLLGKPIDTRHLLALAKSVHTWSAVSSFYYIPVLLILIKSAIRNI